MGDETPTDAMGDDMTTYTQQKYRTAAKKGMRRRLRYDLKRFVKTGRISRRVARAVRTRSM